MGLAMVGHDDDDDDDHDDSSSPEQPTNHTMLGKVQWLMDSA